MTTKKNGELRKMAWENYRHVQIEAERAYDATLTNARNNYEREVDQAREHYDAAKREAQGAYENIVAGAKRDYNRTVTMMENGFRHPSPTSAQRNIAQPNA